MRCTTVDFVAASIAVRRVISAKFDRISEKGIVELPSFFDGYESRKSKQENIFNYYLLNIYITTNRSKWLAIYICT